MNETIRQAGLVFMGAGIGGTARFMVGGVMREWMPRVVEAFPWPTLLINVAGCLAIGLLSSGLKGDGRALVITGVLGGFTTFSAFGLETMEMWTKGYAAPAIWYVVLSVVFGLGATALGMWVTTGAAR